MAPEILLVKIHHAINEGKDCYEATRGHWKINERRLKDIAYVAGVNRGNVVCAYIPSEWYVVHEGSDAGKKGIFRSRSTRCGASQSARRIRQAIEQIW